jgi:dipeptidyl aminopeptidase/acylaminoacyl peptidase
MDAVNYVLDEGYVDESQLYITGGSGGGVLTAWSIGKTDRFRAAVVAKPVINWYSFTLTADAYPFFAKYWFTKMPWDDQMQYMGRSPISLVGNVATPTMVLVGSEDYRTPNSERVLPGIEAAGCRRLAGQDYRGLTWYSRPSIQPDSKSCIYYRLV